RRGAVVYLVTLEGVGDVGRSLMPDRFGEGRIIARAKRLLDGATRGSHRLEARQNPLCLCVVLVALAEQDVLADNGGLVLSQRLIQPRLHAARPWPVAKVGDALVVDGGDHDRTGRARALDHIHSKVGRFQFGQFEERRMVGVEEKKRDQNGQPDEQRDPCLPAASVDGLPGGHRATPQSLARGTPNNHRGRRKDDRSASAYLTEVPGLRGPPLLKAPPAARPPSVPAPTNAPPRSRLAVPGPPNAAAAAAASSLGGSGG